MAFTNGKWVQFDNEFPGAHKTKAGKTVGIFVRGGVDGLGQPHKDRIMVVDEDGHNMQVIDRGQIKYIELSMEEAVNLGEVESVSDLPAKRMETAREGFKLKAEHDADRLAAAASKEEAGK